MSAEQLDRIAVDIASSCDSHGKPRPSRPVAAELKVALPAQTALFGAADLRVSTCGQCVNLIRTSEVYDHLAWGAGLCAAQGKLILDNRQTTEARGCDDRSHRTLGTTDSPSVLPVVEDMHLFPMYELGFGAADPLKAFEGRATENPSDYPTDKPLTEADKKSGIKAWRKVLEPDGSRFVYLPVYDEMFFSPEERKKIPRTGDKEHPELYIDHGAAVYTVSVAWVELDETPALWGAAGLGKTELLRHMAWMMCLPFERISITAASELDDLAGKMHFENNETVWKNGRIPDAWAKPCVICLDEPNVGPPDVWQFLRPLTDNSKQLVLDQNEGESITRHDDCYLGLAMNPAWDVRNVGTAVIGDADSRRLFHIQMHLPPPSIERQIIKDRVKLDGWDIPKATLNMVMKIAEDLRKLSENGTLPISWGIGHQIKVARALRWFDPSTAYRVGAADALEPEASQALLTTVAANTPSPVRTNSQFDY
jgi:MoxR-like ATPase